ncbi:transposase [Streptomyces griseochromogenes]|uniref:Transposase n=1 Tax=Streptomyces griseochromogenes TaxID=68214 RepID=A0ABS4LR31_9ACTN|nr:transposase [Streptomyces griseochromogenes]
MLTALTAQPDVDEDLAWAVSVESTIVRAPQHAAGARKEGSGRRTGPTPGRPGTMPDMHLADMAHSPRAIRDHWRKRGARAVIPFPAGHRLRRGSRPPAFGRETYKQRNTVEWCFNRLCGGTDTVLTVDGTLVPTRDHSIAEQSKNYRYSTDHQVVADADRCLVVEIGRPVPGNRNDCTA